MKVARTSGVGNLGMGKAETAQGIFGKCFVIWEILFQERPPASIGYISIVNLLGGEVPIVDHLRGGHSHMVGPKAT